VLARITRLVVEAQSRRGPSERFVERFARDLHARRARAGRARRARAAAAPGRPWGASLYDALVLLVIACPCALVISTPVSVVCALASAARQGVLVKGGRLVEAPAGLRADGARQDRHADHRPAVVSQVIPFDTTTSTTCSAARGDRVAQPAPARRGHRGPRAAGRLPAPARPRRARAARPRCAGHARGPRLVDRQPPLARGARQETPEVHATLERLEAEGRSVVILGKRAPRLRSDRARGAAAGRGRARHRRAPRAGLAPLVMLTGDTPGAARALAGRLGLDEVRAGLLPRTSSPRCALVAQHGAVAMVGDGSTTRPRSRPARSAWPWARPAATRPSRHADVVIMSDDLSRLPWLVRTAAARGHDPRQRRGLARHQGGIIGLALVGWASLWGAIAADMGVSLLVVANAMRLLRASAPPAAQTP
jgi:Cd2+/Zn2+-exporting ATPase